MRDLKQLRWKTWLAAVLAPVLVLSLASCKKSGGGGDAATDAELDTAPDATGDAADDGTDDAPGDVAEDDGGDPCWAYPCESTGWELGNVVQDLAFTPANEAATTIAGTDGSFDMHDLYQLNEEHGGNLKGVLIWLSTGWCTYCAQEAPKLQGLYEDLHADGIEIVGLISETTTPGVAADATFAASYASGYGWTFPAVAGDINIGAYPPADRSEPGVPLHFFVDLRNMRIYGRFPGAVEMKLPRYALEDLIAGPDWGTGAERIISFDCSPGTGNETEPNSLATTPHDGTSLPVTLQGVQCPPVIADGLLYEEDVIDLGTLSAGDVVEVSMSATSTDTYPFFELLSTSGGSINWSNMGPAMHDATSARRQWVIHQAGRYYAAALDGRFMASRWYASGATIPVEDQCCEGGPSYTYDLTVSEFTLAATETDLTVGSAATATMDDGDLNVHPLTVTSGTAYTITMTADDTSFLDPLLVLYDPTAGTVLAENDDISYPANINSSISWTATGDMTVWVVASYWGAWYRLGAPGYTLLAE